MKLTVLGAGSTVFSINLVGDCLLSELLRESTFALYDIDPKRLEEAKFLLDFVNAQTGSKGKIECYLGEENRKDALKDADFVVSCVQIGGYEPCTVIDFEVPKKYGLKQTIGDTVGIGGIMRALRTIPVIEDFVKDMEEVCPNALFLNYTNPMAMVTGYIQRYRNMNTIGLCHSVPGCAPRLLTSLGMQDKLENHKRLIAGINHQAWLLEIKDKNGVDLYPEVKKRIEEKMNQPDFDDKVRFEYIKRLGYYCTESSEHNAEYNPFFIKSKYPELIERYNIPIDEYPRRCRWQIDFWNNLYAKIQKENHFEHHFSNEYAYHIMESMTTGAAYELGGNVINKGHLITNLPEDACVEVPCMVDAHGIHPCYVGALPPQLAAMNMTNINTQLLTIEAARTRKRENIYHAAMFDPHTAAELSIDDIVAMCDELILEHQKAGFMLEYK